MKRKTKLLVIISLAVTVIHSITSCGHTHIWTDWERDEFEHWRVCAVEGCKEEERETHSASTCSECAYTPHVKEPEHTHIWAEWERDEFEHWRVCTVENCKKEEREIHSEGTCSECAYGLRILSFGFDQGGDPAHSDFAREANAWFSEQGEKLGFSYTYAGNNFSALNDKNLENYDLIMFLNNIPGGAEQQEAFRKYMDNGGAFIAFHSAGFAMWDGHTPPSDWYDWYHNTLLCSGEYGNCADPDDPSIVYWNTWNPTSEPLKIETHNHFCTANIEGDEIISAPCEWYAWANNLMDDPAVTVLLTLNPSEENPAGDDPRTGMEFQIWKTGHHPIAWAINDYNAVYMNWGHNLQSYNHFEKESSTFSSEKQNQFMINAIYGVVQNSLKDKNK